MEKEKKAGRVLRALSNAILILFVLLLLLAFFAGMIRKKPLFLFGYTYLYVETGSMENTIPTGSFILVQRVDGKEVAAGDIITFVCPDETSAVYGRLITHRVVGVSENGYRTKGDHVLATEDPFTVKPTDVVARYVRNLPFLSTVGRLFSSCFGLALIFSAFFFCVCSLVLPELNRKLRAETSAAEKEKEAEMARRIGEEVEKLKKENRRDDGGNN